MFELRTTRAVIFEQLAGGPLRPDELAPCPQVRCQRVPLGSLRTTAPSAIATKEKMRWSVPVGFTRVSRTCRSTWMPRGGMLGAAAAKTPVAP